MKRLFKAVALIAAIAGLLLGFTASADAATSLAKPLASCETFGCDGHNPNIQTWQSPGAGTARIIDTGVCGDQIELRTGKTDGDRYAWARATWVTGCYGGSVYVNRRPIGAGPAQLNLGRHTLNASGWTQELGSITYQTWSGMYDNPSSYQVQACLTLTGQGDYCTGWHQAPPGPRGNVGWRCAVRAPPPPT